MNSPRTEKDHVCAEAVAQAWAELHLGQMLPSAGSVMVHRRMIKEIMVVVAKATYDIMVPPHQTLRPADTTAQTVRCPGSKRPPLSATIQSWGTHGGRSGICPEPDCERRIRLYPTGMIAVHKKGR